MSLELDIGTLSGLTGIKPPQPQNVGKKILYF